MRTAQELFDTIVNHLRKQHARSISRTEHGASFCAYRGENGLKCAVGAVIPDELYSPAWEKNAIDILLGSGELPESLQQEFRTHHDLLVVLQQVHDSVSVIELWESWFEDIAKTHQLQYTPFQP